jgi:hypothetical protein
MKVDTHWTRTPELPLLMAPHATIHHRKYLDMIGVR